MISTVLQTGQETGLETCFESRYYAELDSTNEEAKRLLSQGTIVAPTMIIADRQTAGKGTQGRQWFSPSGAGLYFSIVHPFPDQSAQQSEHQIDIPLTPLFTLAAGVACAESLLRLTGLNVQLKPVNDLYLDGRKLGGILTESLVSDHRCKALITGIGINLREHSEIRQACADEQRGNDPISLQTCMAPEVFNGFHPDWLIKELTETIASAVDTQYRQLIQGQTEALLDTYQRYKIPHVEFTHITSFA
jgi:biotin-[acetyl-CoA-carboxylase] ligase BirA-like protein